MEYKKYWNYCVGICSQAHPRAVHNWVSFARFGYTEIFWNATRPKHGQRDLNLVRTRGNVVLETMFLEPFLHTWWGAALSCWNSHYWEIYFDVKSVKTDSSFTSGPRNFNKTYPTQLLIHQQLGQHSAVFMQSSRYTNSTVCVEFTYSYFTLAIVTPETEWPIFLSPAINDTNTFQPF